MSSAVVVLCPNGRRVTVRLNINSPLLTFLEQACQKQGFDSTQYELRRGKAIMDLTIPFRFSGLTNNAKLDLVKTDIPRNLDGDVLLSVQTESGARIERLFNSSVSLWQVITDLNLSSNHGSVPSILYMRQHVIGIDQLSTTTLRSLGVACGRVSLRFVSVKAINDDVMPMTSSVETETQPVLVSGNDDVINEEITAKPTCNLDDDVMSMTSLVERQPVVVSGNDEVINEEVMTTPTCNLDDIEFPVLPISIFPTDNNVQEMETDTPLHYTEPETDTPLHHTETDTPLQYITTLSELNDGALNRKQLLPKKTTNVVKQKPNDDRPIYEGPCDRNPVIFSLNESLSVPVAEVSDEFFQPTIKDVRMMQQDLQKKVKELSDAPLLTKQLQQEQYCNYTKTIIRIILPNQLILQGTFNSRESVKCLVVFIREHLLDPTIKFHLYTTPPKQILTSSRPTLASLGFVPAANVHLGLDNINPLPSPSTNINPLLSSNSITHYKCSTIEADIITNNERLTNQTTNTIITDHHKQQQHQTGIVKPHPLKNQSIIITGSGVENEQKIPKWFKKRN